MMHDEIVSIQNLDFAYPRMEDPLLRNINLEIQEEEFVILTGANGSGKTSLGKCMNGLIPYSTGGTFRGKVEVCGFNTLQKDVSELALHVGYVFSNPEDQLATPRVETEVAFGLCNLGVPRQTIHQRVDKMLDQLHISELKHASTFDLSTGQQQMIAIASCLVMEPRILVLDDPLSHLNRNTSDEFVEIISNLNRNGTTIIWISQDVSEVFEIADRVVLLDGGEIVFSGSPESMSKKMDFEDSALIVPQYLEPTQALTKAGFSSDLIEISLAQTIQKLKGLMGLASPLEELGEAPLLFDRKDSEPIVRFDHVTFRYPNGFLALKDIELDLHAGDFVLLSGWNGSGKTTLTKHINGLLRPTDGAVYIEGKNISRKPTSDLAIDVGFLFQNPDHQLHKPTVRDELAFSLKNFSVPEEGIRQKVSKVSEEFGLESLLDRSPQELSGSEKKKVTVASVLIYDPKIVVLDEATANLDRSEARKIIETIENYFDEDKIILSISHDIRMWADSDRLNRVLIMKDGTIVDDGTPEKVLSNSEIMEYLYGALLPVTQIAHSLSDNGVSPTHYKARTLTEELVRLLRSTSDVSAQ
jgi:energy-coupling factor transport system ATP-binding protein